MELFTGGLRLPNPRLVWNLTSDVIASKENSVCFFLTMIWRLHALKKIEKIIPKTLLNRGIIKPELNFNPGLTLISLRKTGTCRRISDEIWGFSSFSVTCALQKKNFVLSALFSGKLTSYTHGLTSFILV